MDLRRCALGGMLTLAVGLSAKAAEYAYDGQGRLISVIGVLSAL